MVHQIRAQRRRRCFAERRGSTPSSLFTRCSTRQRDARTSRCRQQFIMAGRGARGAQPPFAVNIGGTSTALLRGAAMKYTPRRCEFAVCEMLPPAARNKGAMPAPHPLLRHARQATQCRARESGRRTKPTTPLSRVHARAMCAQKEG